MSFRDSDVRRSAILACPGVAHGFFNAKGGAGAPPFAGLNLSFAVGDDPAMVAENRELLRRYLGLDALVAVGQVHSGRVLRIDSPPEDGDPPGYDAIITAAAGIGIMIMHADCQAVLFCDPSVPAVGIAHCGWRGNVVDICAATVAAMVEAYGCDPARIRAAVGPSLGPCCAEFKGYRELLPDWMWEYRRGDFFDFPAITRRQLVDSGLRPENIDPAHHCSHCDRDFFSHRRDHGKTGRQGSVIGLCDGI